jgi:hypothetical protein
LAALFTLNSRLVIVMVESTAGRPTYF